MGNTCAGNNGNNTSDAMSSQVTDRSTKITESKTAEFNDIDYTQDVGLKLHPKNELPDLTYDIKKDLVKLQAFYPKEYKELVPRKEIETVFYNNFKANDIESNSFTVMQFNMLADSLSRAYMPAGFESEKAFIGVDQRCLEWRYRGLRIVEEIIRMSPDIICLQECDRAKWLDQYLSKLKYKFEFQEKPIAPGVRDVMPATNQARAEARQSIIQKNANNNDNDEKSNNDISNEDVKFEKDGCVIFYNTNKFELVSEKLQKFGEGSNKEGVVGIAAPFRLKSNKKFEFLCVTTHLKSAKTEDGERKREVQISCLLEKLVKNEDNLPILLCLDMNAAHINGKYEALCYNKITNGLGYRSLCKEAQTTSEEMKDGIERGKRGTEPKFTTYKTRPTGTVKHTIDYIFENDTDLWSVTKYWDIPDTAQKIPDWDYPSDHFSLCLQLTWNQ